MIFYQKNQKKKVILKIKDPVVKSFWVDALTKKQEKSQQELDEMGNELIFRVKNLS